MRQIGINGEAMKGDGKALMVNGEVLKRNEYALYGMLCDGEALNVNVRALKGDALMGKGDKTNRH